MRALFLCLAATSAILALPMTARGDNAAKVEAETLFQAGRELLAKGDIEEACKKFEASEKIDRALGTMLRLADCYERSGRTASAWALFREAASVAQASSQSSRADIARTRADALEPKLARLELRVHDTEHVPGLELSVADVAVPEATWGVAVPVDPGTPTIRAIAPGRVVWTKTVDVPAGQPKLEIIDIPPLEPLPPQVAPQAPPESPTKKTEPAASAPAQSNVPKSAEPAVPSPDPRYKTQRTIGIITGGVGLGAITVGGVLGVQAILKNDASLSQCRPKDPSLCTSSGVSLRREAQASALGSTVSLAAGATVLATGIIVFVTAPKHAAPAAPRVAATPIITNDTAGFVAGGVF